MTPDDISREANEIWLAERRQRLVANLLKNRPAEFAAPGELDPGLKEWALLLAAGVSQNLILTGPVGTGKTWAAWRAAEEAVCAGYERVIVIATAAKFRRIIAPATADVREFERYCAVGLLVLDDVGAFGLSEWDLDNLMELVDSRWASQLPTAVTSNTTDLRALLGERISSRLAHKALILELDGPDRRRQP